MTASPGGFRSRGVSGLAVILKAGRPLAIGGIPQVNAKNVRCELLSELPVFVPETKAFDEYATVTLAANR
ncbi:MAG: hypothetical protein WAW61_03465 [Methylococcaceae bacterium]